MTTPNRYLRFETIALDELNVRASCSRCGKEFSAEPTSGESAECLLRRIRAQFDAHKCNGS
jgi:hypothetical protein